MMLISRTIISQLFLFLPTFLISQVNSDSIEISKVNYPTLYYTESQFENNDSISPLENSLTGFQNYQSRNNLGNRGLANTTIYLPSFSNQTEFNYSKNNFQHYFTSHQNIRYYNTKTPHTDLFYVIGSKKEQSIDMTFSYNVKENWNVTAAFNRIRSDGFYLRQSTNDNTLSMSSNYRSHNNRYYLLANIIYNTAANAENGGLSNDTSATSTSLTPNLSNAKRRTHNKGVYLKQYFNFGEKSTDSTRLNSILTSNRLILTSHIENEIYTYEDLFPTEGYYSTIYFDSIQTYDSINVYKIDNELEWKRVDNKKHRGINDLLGVSVKVKHQYISISQNEKFDSVNTSSTYNNIIAGAGIYNTYSNNNLWWKISANYTLEGYNKDNYYSEASLIKKSNDSLSIFSLITNNQSYKPSYLHNHFSSNNFKWKNNFKQTQSSYIAINYTANKYKLSLSASYTNYENFVYLDQSATPKQHNNSFAIMGANVKKDFKFWNFHLDNKIDYQYVPDSSIIRIPEFVFEHSLYYETNVFKKAAQVQIGVSLFYASAFYGNAYMSSTAQFYLQDENKTGNYPFLNFFINAKIKTARIFFKIDHLNSGISGDNYTFSPYNPINTRAFKLGVSWRFFD